MHRVIQQQVQTPGVSGRLSAVFVADETRSRSNLLATTRALQWLTYPAIRQQSMSVDPVSLGIISQLENGSNELLPVELIESLDANYNRRLQKHLEKQMLMEANYGKGGNPFFLSLFLPTFLHLFLPHSFLLSCFFTCVYLHMLSPPAETGQQYTHIGNLYVCLLLSWFCCLHQ